jgi:anti-sigma B factor antagonist
VEMSGVQYMSSAGLRVLLSTHRQVASQSARLALSGLSADVNETMEATGFLQFFTVFETLDEGLAGLR